MPLVVSVSNHEQQRSSFDRLGTRGCPEATNEPQRE